VKMTETRDADVVIVGGGLAGLCAAIAARKADRSTILIESSTTLGGSALLSGGSLVFAGTDLQADQEIEDSPGILREDLVRIGGRSADPALIDVYMAGQAEAYAWLRKLGVVFGKVTLSGNQSRPRSHGVAPAQLVEVLAAEAERLGVEIVRETKLSHLIKDGSLVTGVEADGPSGPYSIRAGRGVILATGGFSRSERALLTFAPRLVDSRPMSADGSRGDGIYAAMSVGADLSDMGNVKGTFGVSARHSLVPEPAILLIALYRGGIVVDGNGQRFVDESLSYKAIGDRCLSLPDALAYQIFDQTVMDQTDPAKTVNDFAGALKRGYVVQAGSIRELAERAGLDADALEQTVSDYNAAARGEKADAFGRGSLSAGYGELAAIETGPFYLYPSTTGLPSTYGGIRVDSDMNVRDVYGERVAGLWAAGELVGGFHGEGYMSGSSLGKSIIFGLRAGRKASMA